MRDPQLGRRRFDHRAVSSSWIMSALQAAATVYLLGYAVFGVVLNPDRNPYWRATCAILVPFVAYWGYGAAKAAVRQRNRSR